MLFQTMMMSILYLHCLKLCFLEPCFYYRWQHRLSFSFLFIVQIEQIHVAYSTLMLKQFLLVNFSHLYLVNHVQIISHGLITFFLHPCSNHSEHIDYIFCYHGTSVYSNKYGMLVNQCGATYQTLMCILSNKDM